MRKPLRQAASFSLAVPFAAAERLAEMLGSSAAGGGDKATTGRKAGANPLESFVHATFEASERVSQATVDAALGLVPERDCCGEAAASDAESSGTRAAERSTPAGLGVFRRTRRETLEIAAPLSQAEIDRPPAPDKWSVSEVLDHLTRVDRLFREDLDELLERKRDGRPAFVFRGLAESEFTVPGVPEALLPLLDPPLAVLGIAVPRSLRQALLRNRQVPAQAPKIIRPKKGRTAADLRDELGRMVDYVENLFDENPEVSFDQLFYYNPLTGLTTLPGVLEFTASHESRHQEQLREIIAALGS